MIALAVVTVAVMVAFGIVAAHRTMRPLEVPDLDTHPQA